MKPPRQTYLPWHTSGQSVPSGNSGCPGFRFGNTAKSSGGNTSAAGRKRFISALVNSRTSPDLSVSGFIFIISNLPSALLCSDLARLINSCLSGISSPPFRPGSCSSSPSSFNNGCYCAGSANLSSHCRGLTTKMSRPAHFFSYPGPASGQTR